MADKKRGKKRKDDYPGVIEEKAEKPQKEEYAVAKWLRKNVSVKRTKFLNHNVEYFTGSKAVDALLTSPWAKQSSENEEPMFATRQDVSDFLDRMLRHKFFHRAKKVPVSEQELKAKQKKKEKKDKDKDEKKDKDEIKKRKEEETAESSHAEGGKESESGKALTHDEREKKKRKIRLEMHLDQYFVDSLDAYVWIYDPIPVYYWLCGFLLVLGAIAICMFPLWPPTVRMGVYYLSVATAGFLMLIIALAVIRLIIFCLVWLLTLGAHHLWLFPNLTEDVGFFASFWPIYQYEYKGKSGSTTKYSKKKKKEKDSDNEDDDDNGDDSSKSNKSKCKGKKSDDDYDYEDETAVGDTSSFNKEISISNETSNDDKKSEDGGDVNNSNVDTNNTEDRGSETETESEGSSQQSQTGKDFEIVDKADLQES
ncbi:translocation protein 1 [Lycorma delicatula]|uniref:translocation protein 1 n=1 Tax=Lycorma delicatula TaxID=130591 RepID=UPI003F51815A